MSVLIITHREDNECVELVASALAARGHEAVRLDTDLYPTELSLSSELLEGRWRRHFSIGEQTHDLSAVTAVWYRRFAAGAGLPRSLGDHRPACVEESRRALLGLIASLGVFELDPLTAVRRADHKELQLTLAPGLGLSVPRTLISNDPIQVARFARELDGPIVAKMQTSFAIHRHERELVVFTSRVSEDDLRSLDGLKYGPMMFQELVPKRLEIRATVVGNRVYSAAVDSTASPRAEIDWRRDGPGLMNRWITYELPKSVEAGLVALTRELGLGYSAADFILTPDGGHVFLELNASGEWFWLQRYPGLPIGEAIAEQLISKGSR
ncbi:MAG: MvdD family ATP-grasp ribosomal peptide maturase [Deltaproteobacteria bacterium]|nr:MvdD family ATP-grasp ribosomal peptide maturase [Deltaproteobacteria bacterium]